MKTNRLLIPSLLFTLLPACGEETTVEKPTGIAKEKIEWTNLLDSENLSDLWQPATNRKGTQTEEIGKRWELKDSVLTLDFNREGRGGSIETKETYFNFELVFDFNIQENCNSGIKYRLKNSIGFEFQIVDDINYRDNKVSHRTAELYEIKAEETPRKLNPAGEWNSAKIIAKRNTIEHWLNGQKVCSIEYGSDEWKKLFKESKYHKQGHAEFGTHVGPIHLQDHSDTIIAFKNMKIRKLESE